MTTEMINDISQIYKSFINFFRLPENKAWKEFQEVILEYEKAFVPNLEVLQLSSIKRPFFANLVW